MDHLPQPGTQLQPELGVDGGEGLVQQQQLGIGSQGPGESHPLTLAAGQLVGEAAAQTGKADQLQQLLHPGLDLGFGPVLHLQAEGDVFEHGHIAEQGVILEHEAHSPLACLHLVDQSAADIDLAGIGMIQPGQHAQNGGLAGTAGAQQSGEGALAHGEAHVVGGAEIAEGLIDMTHLHVGVAHGRFVFQLTVLIHNRPR